MRKTIAQLQRGYKPQTQPANLRVCPVCKTAKRAHEFRQSNQNAKRNLICWQCRKNYDGVEAQFYAGTLSKGLIEKATIPRLTGREPRVLKHRFRNVYKFVTRLRERRILRRKEVLWMAENQAVALLKLPERIAAVIGKTYIVRGDDPNTIPDDEALMRIRDLLDEFDEKIIGRNKDKRLIRR